MATYVYSIATDTVNGRVNLDDLGNSIRDLNLSPEYQGGTTSGDVLTLFFADDLSVSEQAALTAAVAAHDGVVNAREEAEDPVGLTLLYFSSIDDPIVNNYKSMQSANDFSSSVVSLSASEINAAAYGDPRAIKRFRLPTLQTILEKGYLQIRAFISADNDSEISGQLKIIVTIRDAAGAEVAVLREISEKKNFGIHPKKVFIQIKSKALLKPANSSIIFRVLFAKTSPTPAVVLGKLNFMLGGLDCSRVSIPGRIV